MTVLAGPAAVTAWRPFRVTVGAVWDLSPTLRRVRFVGPDLADFADPGYDQRIKLLLGSWPGAGHATADWFTRWAALAETDRPPMRTYTTRRVTQTAAGVAVDVDMVVHGAPGPAGDWARRARVGDEVILVGPDARFEGDHGGRAFAPPEGTREVVLLGDETGLPAVARILEDLAAPGGPRMRVTALLEVPCGEDRLDLVAPAGAEIVWLVRGVRPPGHALDGALRRWTRQAAGSPAAPPTGVYVWAAAEQGVVRGLRRHLLDEAGLGRQAVALMGYWRRRPAAA